jgi:hypothetical protein
MTTPHITTLPALRQLYGPARERSLKKEIPALDAHAMQFIGLSPFVVLASSDAHGHMDASPRGGEPGFVKVLDAQTLLVPDAPGNNRLDTLENIIATGRRHIAPQDALPQPFQTRPHVHAPALLLAPRGELGLLAAADQCQKKTHRRALAPCASR